MDRSAIPDRADPPTEATSREAGHRALDNRNEEPSSSYSRSDRASTSGGHATSVDSDLSVPPDNPAPLSSALHIPTLLDESDPSGASKSEVPPDNPAPLSSALHIPTLLHESEPSGTSKSPVPADDPAPLSSALHIPTLLKEPKSAGNT
jgi:hypothetical protein